MLIDKKSSEEQNNSARAGSLWQRIKSLFFRPTPLKLAQIQTPDTFVSSDFKDWLKAIDTLMPLVQAIRHELDISHFEKLDLELLGANTYLYHIDRLLVKVREHFMNYRYRRDQFDHAKDIIQQTEFLQVNQSCCQCYQTIVNLTQALESLPRKKLYSDDFITLIHAFELEATTLGSAMRALNQLAYRQEAIFQIDALEKNLLQSLTQTRLLEINNDYGTVNQYTSHPGGSYYSVTHNLRDKMFGLENNEHRALLEKAIEIYDVLNKCYVVARKSTVKASLDIIADHIEKLIDAFCDTECDKTRIYRHLTTIFYQLECLRFSSNRESRCSRNLFEKSKWAKHQLKKACAHDTVAGEFIKKISIKRISLLKKNNPR